MRYTTPPIIVALLVASLTSCNERKEEPTRPNIVLFMVDDMGWQDTSVPFWDRVTPFNERYITPNMERLASQGMKFTQAYATPVCSPTRVSLMTGMNATRHRVTNWTLRKDELQPMETNHKTLEFPKWNVNGLSPDKNTPNAVYCTPLPQVLHDAGYFAIHVGKAHFGAIGTPGENPLNLGFDANIAGHAAGGPRSYYGTENFGNDGDEKNIWAVPGLEKYHGKDIFLTEALTREALSTLSKVPKEKPFFLYMAHYAVHIPLYADKRFLQKYLDMGLDEKEAKYATMVEGMDKSLGDIMDYLEEKNLEENTIILFMSDNGGLSAVARGGEPHTHNKPLKSGKGSMYEGGIREPMIVKWPGVTASASSTNQRVIIEDFYPTILDMAGIENYKTVQRVDGKSFIPILRGEEVNSEKRALFWHYPNNWGIEGPGIGATSVVRLGDWKLIYYHDDERMELFNIQEDIGEENDLGDKNYKKLRELATVLSNYLRDVNAQMPKHKEEGEQVAYPDNHFPSMIVPR